MSEPTIETKPLLTTERLLFTMDFQNQAWFKAGEEISSMAFALTTEAGTAGLANEAGVVNDDDVVIEGKTIPAGAGVQFYLKTPAALSRYLVTLAATTDGGTVFKGELRIYCPR